MKSYFKRQKELKKKKVKNSGGNPVSYKRPHDAVQMETMEQKYSCYQMCEMMFKTGGITKSVLDTDKENGISDLVYVYKGDLMGKVPNFDSCEYWINQIPLSMRLPLPINF